MSKISLSPEQYEILNKSGIAHFNQIGDDLYEILPFYEMDDFEYMEREKCLGIACNVPVKCLQELFDNAEKIRQWLEGEI